MSQLLIVLLLSRDTANHPRIITKITDNIRITAKNKGSTELIAK